MIEITKLIHRRQEKGNEDFANIEEIRQSRAIKLHRKLTPAKIQRQNITLIILF